MDSLRSRLGATPRKLGWFATPPIAYPVPDFLRDVPEAKAEVKRVFAHFGTLWKKGVVVWGQVIMANRQLFEPGEQDLPGYVLYSLGDDDAHAVERLPLLVARLHELREKLDGDEPLNEHECQWCEDLMRGDAYHEGYPLPDSWQPPGQVYQSTSPLFHRGHLPDGKLGSRLLPLLVNPEKPHLVMVVPHEFWPAGLNDWLLAREQEHERVKTERRAAKVKDRETAYAETLGPIASVFHPIDQKEGHVDVYSFDGRQTPIGAVTYLTGGMSDRKQPVEDETFERIELAFYARQPEPRFAELLRMLSEFPWSAGTPLQEWDTLPLGDQATLMLGTDRFTALLLIPGMKKAHHALLAKPLVEGRTVPVLTVWPLLPDELDLKLKNWDAFRDLLRTKSWDMTFNPQRTSLIESSVRGA